MSRGTIILLVVLCAGVAGLIVFSKMRSVEKSPNGQQAVQQPGPGPGAASSERAATSPFNSSRITQPAPNPPPTITTIATSAPPMATVPRASNSPGIVHAPTATNQPDNLVPEIKPLPVLEKEYLTTTNRDSRLDLIMDIAEAPGPDSVKALTRLFEEEKDTDLKVDLLDSLLGIEGFKEEKLIMLTLGARQGLPVEVRQSAIDGLIDLDDQRVVPVLNGLLNDPDPEIREGAKDALEMIQTPTQVIVK